MRRWLGKGARVTTGDELPLSTADLLARLASAHPRKMIASDTAWSSGWTGKGGATC